MTHWPKDTAAARNAFYGDPAKGEIESQLVSVVPPFAMYYEGKRVSAIRFHRLAAPALKAALDEIWDAYGRDQTAIDRAGISRYAGAYNHRKVRGSRTKWSNHAYGAAIDINAAENAMGTAGNMPQAVIDAFCRQRAMWGGWYRGRKDPMHFEFVDNGGRAPKNPPPATQPVALADPGPSVRPAHKSKLVRGGILAWLSSVGSSGVGILSYLNNPYVLAAFVIVIVLASIGLWLVLSGRIELKKLVEQLEGG